MERKWGRDHDEYRIYVNGLPPIGGGGGLIPVRWIENAKFNDIEVDESDAIVMGVDPAGKGNDSTWCCIRQGGFIHGFEKVNKIDTEEIAQEVVKIAYKWGVSFIIIDAT